MDGDMPRDQYTDVGGVKTRFWSSGESGSPVVLIHGLGLSIEYWAANVRALAEHHRILALDLVGFGRSEKPAIPYTLERLALFVRDFLRGQGVERATWVGLSMGGGIALRAAIEFPEAVDRLVLVDCSGLGRRISLLLRLASLPLVGVWITRPSREGSAQFLRSSVYDPALISDEWIERDYQFALDPGARRAFLSALRNGVNLWGVRRDVVRAITDRLPTLAVPTLVLWGRQDRILPVAHAHVAAAAIPGAQLHIFEQCGHFPPLEVPDAFNARVLAFLAGQEME
jgi:4,5:9,10-diseco-3-hydroxy-5,9,17-trioxoandrosta-1(10),2-diene-4-oate hydrolase